ncbi:MAG: YceI family protein, partial [Desulfococcaceae bacterium]
MASSTTADGGVVIRHPAWKNGEYREENMENPRYPTVSAPELKAGMDRKDAFYLVDALPQDHFQKVRLSGTGKTCVYEMVFTDHILGITEDPHAELVLRGAGGPSRDAAAAAEELWRMGHARVSVFAGGLAEWRSAGYPLKGEAPAAPDPLEPTYRFSEGRYVADPSGGVVEWSGRNANGKHYGTIHLAEREIAVAGNRPTGGFSADMATIRNQDLAGDPCRPALIDHLMPGDFFFVQRFPKAHFQVRKVIPLTDATPTEPNYQIEGELE